MHGHPLIDARSSKGGDVWPVQSRRGPSKNEQFFEIEGGRAFEALLGWQLDFIRILAALFCICNMRRVVQPERGNCVDKLLVIRLIECVVQILQCF